MISTITRKSALIPMDIVRTNILMKKNRIFLDIYIKITKLSKLPPCKSFTLIKKKKEEQNLSFICMRCFICSVPPKRIIIRQGHFAENFYFIVSGQGKTSIMTQISSNSGENCNHFVLK